MSNVSLIAKFLWFIWINGLIFIKTFLSCGGVVGGEDLKLSGRSALGKIMLCNFQWFNCQPREFINL